MFFGSKKSTSEATKAIDNLQSAISLSNRMVIDIVDDDKKFNLKKADYRNAINLGFYLFCCVTTIQSIGVIKEKAILNEVMRYAVENLLSLKAVNKFGFDDSNYQIFANLYKEMLNRSNRPCSGNVVQYFAEICAEFISKDLGMKYSENQQNFLSSLIYATSKNLFTDIVVASMNLNIKN